MERESLLPCDVSAFAGAALASEELGIHFFPRACPGCFMKIPTYSNYLAATPLGKSAKQLGFIIHSRCWWFGVSSQYTLEEGQLGPNMRREAPPCTAAANLPTAVVLTAIGSAAWLHEAIYQVALAQNSSASPRVESVTSV